jgi:hypothetical protein
VKKQGARIRAAIVDAKGLLDMRRWEETSVEHMGHIWFTDCDKLYEHLISSGSKQVDNKRLAIDLAALRQLIWERAGERTDVIDTSSGDYPRWIDTSTMIEDPLTKVMAANRLIDTMMSDLFDMTPTEESLVIKAKNRLCRKSKKETEKHETKLFD